MRILEIKNSHAIIEVESTELDRIVNDYLDLQYAVGYEDGANDWAKAFNNEDEEIIKKSMEMWADANVDDDNPKKERGRSRNMDVVKLEPRESRETLHKETP